MTAKDKADRLVQMFGLEKAKQYVILWQDEYITEQDRIFRQEVKQEILDIK
jgi:hypothetical protein